MVCGADSPIVTNNKFFRCQSEQIKSKSGV